MNTPPHTPSEEKPIVYITDEAASATEQPVGEVPVITIEDDVKEPTQVRRTEKRRRRLPIAIAVAIGVVCLCALYVALRAYNYYYNIGLPIAVSPQENIEKLSRVAPSHANKEIELTQDSILGVAINLYSISHLQGQLSLTEPSEADTSVLMYSRSCDYTSAGSYLGSLVVEGKTLQTDVNRLGYCAMANGNIVIGISRSDRVKDYCEEHGGSFFRQFVLLSGGVMPTKFYLHGKVERRAIGRMANDELFYIETRHKETLWDFADALREYGFVDAIYITGGSNHTFYRDRQGLAHNVGQPQDSIRKKADAIIPWLVLKARR